MTILVGLDLHRKPILSFSNGSILEFAGVPPPAVSIGMYTFSPKDWKLLERRRNVFHGQVHDYPGESESPVAHTASLDSEFSEPSDHFLDIDMVSKNAQTYWNSIQTYLGGLGVRKETLPIQLGFEYLEIGKNQLKHLIKEGRTETSLSEKSVEQNLAFVALSQEEFLLELQKNSLMCSDYHRTFAQKISKENYTFLLAESNIAYALFAQYPNFWDEFIDEAQSKEGPGSFCTVHQPDNAYSYKQLNVQRHQRLAEGKYLTTQTPELIGCFDITEPWTSYFEITKVEKQGDSFMGEVEHVHGKQTCKGIYDENGLSLHFWFSKDSSDAFLNSYLTQFSSDSPNPLTLGTSKKIFNGTTSSHSIPSIISTRLNMTPTQLGEEGVHLLHRTYS